LASEDKQHNPAYPVSTVLGNHDFAYIYQGYQEQPQRVDLLDGTVVDAGIEPPPKPTVAVANNQDVSEELDRRHADKLDQRGIGDPNWVNPIEKNTDRFMQYFVTRMDVIVGGKQYSYSPNLTIEAESNTDLYPEWRTDRGPHACEAQANAFVTKGQVAGVKILDGGRGYKQPPTIFVERNEGHDSQFRAILDNGFISDPTQDAGQIVTYSLVKRNKEVPNLGYVLPDGTPDFTSTSSGRNTAITAGDATSGVKDVAGNEWTFVSKSGSLLTYQVKVVQWWGKASIKGTPDGAGIPNAPDANPPTEPAVLQLTFNSVSKGDGQSETKFYPYQLTSGGVKLVSSGKGSSTTTANTLLLESLLLGTSGVPDGTTANANGTQPLILEFYTGSNPDAPANKFLGGTFYSIKEIVVEEEGADYVGRPILEIDDTYGTGGVAQGTTKTGTVTRSGTVTKGFVESVEVVKGGSYTQEPEVKIISGGASVTAITRAHIRGKYQCYTRFVDTTEPTRGGPIPSNLSELCEINTTETVGDGTNEETQAGAGAIKWTLPATTERTDGRQLQIELWRSTANQSTTLYRVAKLDWTLSTGTYVDDLTDDELMSADRPDMLAMPILLANGELNANRFGIPPNRFRCATMFQDRVFVAGDTGSGEVPVDYIDKNTIYYSEVDEPESIPETNDLILQTNIKSQDHITALIPHGDHMAVMQSHVYHSLSFVKQPLIDANIAITAYRGCVNQRTWDEYAGVLYVMDTDGVYMVESSGEVTPISSPITQIFENKIDWTKSTWYTVQADHNNQALRVSVRFYEDGEGEWPTRQLCYSFLTQSWWEARYPLPLVGCANVRDPNGDIFSLYGSRANTIFRLDDISSERDYCFNAVTSVEIVDPGNGYEKPPKVTVPGGAGCIIDTCLDLEGRVSGAYIRAFGYDYPEVETDCIVEAPTNSDSPSSDTAQIRVSTQSRVYLDIPCSMKTGNFEYEPDGDTVRDVSLLYTPTPAYSEIKLVMYYNNSEHPRTNVAERERGDGLVYNVNSPLTTMNTHKNNLPPQEQNGMAQARFQGFTDSAIKGNDRHVAIELRALAGVKHRTKIHTIDIMGVGAKE
jgi:hypothetical protein